MFTISLTDILASYTGDTQTFEFRGVVPKGYFSDIEFLDELVMRIKLVTLDEAVEVVFESITSKVRYDGSTHAVAILWVSRIFKKSFDPLSDPDDVGEITSNDTIDIWRAIREEVIMSIHP